MATVSSTSGSISSPGIGSGLDVNTIITQLMAVESQPLTQLQTAASTIQTKISEVGKITSALSAFRDAAAKLASVDFWKQTTGSSQSSAVGISTSTGASAADYSVSVQTLASAQAIASPVFASSTATPGSGTLHIELGSWGANQASFTPSTGSTAVDVSIAASDTLATVRDKINAAGAGVTASILSDASGARLVLRSNSTGAANAFRTSVTGTGLGGLAYDPSQGSSGATLSQGAADATATINGLAVSSASNTLANVLDGVTLTLAATTTSPVQVSVKADTASMKTALQNFATTYTSLNQLIATDTKYDAASKKAGPLQGDSSVVGLQRQLRSLLGSSSAASSAFAHLSDAGFEMQRDGSLTANSGKLDNALANLPQLKALFATTNPTDATQSGFAQRVRAFADTMLGTGGSLSARTDGLNSQLKRNQQNQTDMQARLDRTQAMLTKQYTALDTQLGTMSSLSTFVTNQVAQWNK